jgi:serine/threonine protein kinase
MATSTASQAPPQDPLLGKAVGGRYTIERLIGRGGVGLVYLADDARGGATSPKQVVVKVLAPHWAEDRDAVARFDREALRMAKLDHPNVVKMYDHGHFEGRAYIVMEFIRGEPLRRYLGRRKRMPLEEFAPIAAQILRGAGYVHERGIMMRDIKPPNIMLCDHEGRSNHVKLLDFGLAKLIEEDEEDDITKAHVIGTAAYMSPEQIRGDKIDVRVDVYALGVLFFLMLTGEQPIAGDNDAAVLVNHVHGVPKSLAERLPKGHRFSPELIALFESCLAKDPKDRPAHAGAMAERLCELVPAPLLELPASTIKTRAPADAYWAARLSSGPAAAAALESDGNDSAEWTRPLLRRAAKAGLAPLKLAEAELAAQEEKNKAAPEATTSGSGALPRPPRPRTTTGSGVTPRPTSGSGAMPRPRPPGPPPAPPKPRTTPMASPPGSATVRVTAADAKEAVAKLEEELDAARSGKRTLVPTTTPGAGPDLDPAQSDERLTLIPTKPSGPQKQKTTTAPNSVLGDDRPTLVPTKAARTPTQKAPRLALESDDPVLDGAKTGKRSSVPMLDPAELDLDAESSGDFMPIPLDDDVDAAARPSERIAPTAPSDPMATDALGPMTPMLAPAPQPAADGMRWGAMVAVAGLLALTLGGLTAYLVLSGDEPAPAAATGPSASVQASAAAKGATVADSGAKAAVPEAPPPPEANPGVGMVEVRALAGARVEVDGEDRGEAPVPLELPVGEHRVRVTAPGHYPWQTTIDVAAGANAAVKAELVPMEAAPTPPAGKTGGGKPKSGGGKPKPDASKPEPKPDAKPKPEVFLDPSKGKDNGIFLPVGGK